MNTSCSGRNFVTTSRIFCLQSAHLPWARNVWAAFFFENRFVKTCEIVFAFHVSENHFEMTVKDEICLCANPIGPKITFLKKLTQKVRYMNTMLIQASAKSPVICQFLQSWCIIVAQHVWNKRGTYPNVMIIWFALSLSSPPHNCALLREGVCKVSCHFCAASRWSYGSGSKQVWQTLSFYFFPCVSVCVFSWAFLHSFFAGFGRQQLTAHHPQNLENMIPWIAGRLSGSQVGRFVDRQGGRSQAYRGDPWNARKFLTARWKMAGRIGGQKNSWTHFSGK